MRERDRESDRAIQEEEKERRDETECRGEELEDMTTSFEEEQRKLEALGWTKFETQGKILWKNPQTGHLYPQDRAIALIREGRLPGNLLEESEESAE
jgi:hypothetical protein